MGITPVVIIALGLSLWRCILKDKSKRMVVVRGRNSSAGLPASENALMLLWEATGELESLLPRPYHFRACIFGSARIGPEQVDYQETRRLARELASRGIDVVTGGWARANGSSKCRST